MLKQALVVVIFFFLSSTSIFSQNTVGLIQSDAGQQDGYLLMAPIAGKKIYLIDKCGKKINTWTSQYVNGMTSFLSEDGKLVRASNANNNFFSAGGGAMGRLEKLDWASNELWSFTLSDSTQCLHHDFYVMSNGNILALMWTLIPKAQAINWGKDTINTLPDFIWNEKIVELAPIGANTANIVWEWSLSDHLAQEFDSTKSNYVTIANHPELIDFNYQGATVTNEDIFHLNAIDYNAALDQIMITSRSYSEIWVIDHSTTMAEAATHGGGASGKGGDILYRWGNPITYHRGSVTDKKLFECHDGHWINDSLPRGGNMLVFNNGVSRPDTIYSTVEEINPPVNSSGAYTIDSILAFGPDTTVWTYMNPNPTSFYSNRISGTQRLINGNTLISLGNSGEFFEMTDSREIIWKYINPAGPLGPASQGNNPVINQVFHVNFYDALYPGLTGESLFPGVPVELNPVTTPICYFYLGENSNQLNSLTLYPNPTNQYLNITSVNLYGFKIYNIYGEQILTGKMKEFNTAIDLTQIAAGLYTIVFNAPLVSPISYRFIKSNQ